MVKQKMGDGSRKFNGKIRPLTGNKISGGGIYRNSRDGYHLFTTDERFEDGNRRPPVATGKNG